MGDHRNLVLSSLLIFSSILFDFCTAIDTIALNQSIRDGEIIISDGEMFALGFFSPGNSTNRYVGIWYYNIRPQTIAWVANSVSPLANSSGSFTLSSNGDLLVLGASGNVVWSSNSTSTSANSTARLLDTGNLVQREGNSFSNNGRILWQSFDSPSDTLLPNMRIGVNLNTGVKTNLTSWRSESDPAPGDFTLSMEVQEVAQLFIYNRSVRIWRSGQWNGGLFVGIPDMYSVSVDGPILVRDDVQGTIYYSYNYFNNTIKRVKLSRAGEFDQIVFDQSRRQWYVHWTQSKNPCASYGACGPDGFCDQNGSPICSCFRGYEPRSPEEWRRGNWSGGCVRRAQFQCERNISTNIQEEKQDGFLKLGMVKLPDHAGWVSSADRDVCRSDCLRNCTCMAYAYVSGIGCMVWNKELVDIQQFTFGGEELFLRLPDSLIDHPGKKKSSTIIIVVIVLAAVIVGACSYLIWRRRSIKRVKRSTTRRSLTYIRSQKKANVLGDGIKQEEVPELPFFDFDVIETATEYFSFSNKLGEGGFGPVYKGKLPEGQLIAVKRLSTSSGQGTEEFKNEVRLISKLQHKNLVRLLGCCIEGEEKMLLYEFMPNKSLDAFLFDADKRGLLDWNMRFQIIEGIARGLLYLHRDSRLTIIHRDLKVSNILLDAEMRPKISDFGMARIFGGDQLLAKTQRVVGTYGYMAPEYAMAGQFSEKSDIFSFGVLILEIISGMKNSGFHLSNSSASLLAHVWRLWNDGEGLKFIDPSINDSYSETEVLRCIHIGLLCVQDFPFDRPSMSSIVFMLGNESAHLSTPKQPAFTTKDAAMESGSSTSNEICSMNSITYSTSLIGR